MKEKMLVEKLYENKLRELRRSPEAWKEYLETAGKHYKYDFADTLLIEAQDRNASALATKEFWEKQMGFKLKPEAMSIAVLDEKQPNKTNLNYLFDVSQVENIREADKKWLNWAADANILQDIIEKHPPPIVAK